MRGRVVATTAGSEAARLGSTHLGSGKSRFLVWAPTPKKVELHLVGPVDQVVEMQRGDRGYWTLELDGVEPGALYYFRLDGGPNRPDPASRYQPQGVHGPSQVLSDEFEWHDANWQGLPLERFILYELHVGTFTAAGTFEAAIARLDELAELGVTAIEMMPVAQVPGGRNWGYDGASPFAVQNSYGGPEGLKRLVDACHERGLAAVLDVVYNHLGPEGNYLREFGPYFTGCYCTPWGDAVNYDQRWSDEVRRYFMENALYWLEEFHFDALRLDAIHAIFDHSARPFLRQLGQAVEEAASRLGRKLWVMPESDLNDARVVRREERGGYCLSAQWSDDFHHALHCLLTGESTGYYEDFGGLEPLVKSLKHGFVYTGQYSPARGRSHGSTTEGLEGFRFIVAIQNHDQVGNRMLGERISRLTSFEGQKLAAGVVLLSPFLPLLFMGEEYGETAPFLYFVSHTDPELVEAVRRGRAEEFAAFRWEGEPPDPQAVETFHRSKLRPELAREGHHKILWELYRELISLRRTRPALASLSLEDMRVEGDGASLWWRRGRGRDEALAAFHFGDADARLALPRPRERWKKELCSSDVRWGGRTESPLFLDSSGELSLEPKTFALFSREPE